MPSRNKNYIILPKSWSGHGRTDRSGSAGHASENYGASLVITRCYLPPDTGEYAHPSSQAGQYSIYLARRDGRCDDWRLVIHRDGLPVHRLLGPGLSTFYTTQPQNRSVRFFCSSRDVHRAGLGFCRQKPVSAVPVV